MAQREALKIDSAILIVFQRMSIPGGQKVNVFEEKIISVDDSVILKQCAL